jgi:putative oxidoreductase
MKIFVLLGRILFSAIFIISSFKHFFPQTIQYAASQGVPYPSILVPLSGVIALLGGLSVLVGYKARLGAWLLVIFLIPVTLMMHKFWDVSNASAATLQQIMFLKNLSMLGGAFLIAYFGAGPLSIDRE